jgi:hypothetical protein
MTNYCTLDDAKRELKAETALDDAKLRRFIQQVSARIDSTMNLPKKRPYFAPYIEQRTFPLTTDRISTAFNTFLLRMPILDVTAVVKQTTALTSATELYTLDNEVATMLWLSNSAYDWYPTQSTLKQQLYVTGIWGYHDDYDNAWESVDTVQDVGGINASVTSITVADADGADLDGFTPRFSPGHMLQIGTEWLDVTAVNTTTNVLTVRRGVNGSTAAAHTNGAAIATFRVDERIRRVTARQAALLYTRMGAFQVETLDGVGIITYPQDLLTELLNVLTEFSYVQ